MDFNDTEVEHKSTCFNDKRMAAGHKMMQINAVNIILRAPSAKVSIKILTIGFMELVEVRIN